LAELDAEELAHRVGEALEGDVLVGGEVDERGGDVRPVADAAGDFGGELGAIDLAAAGACDLVDLVLLDQDFGRRRDVVQLADFGDA
jgi:hypothetical protein